MVHFNAQLPQPSTNPGGASYMYMHASPPPVKLTMSQLEELINRKLEEQKGMLMHTPFYGASHPYTSKLMPIIVPRDATNRQFLDYTKEGDLV